MQFALLMSVLAPALAGLVVVGVSAIAARVRGHPGLGPGAALSAPLGAFAAYLPVRGMPELPPTDASIWALWLSLAAVAYGTVRETLTPVARWVAGGVWTVVTLSLVWQPAFAYGLPGRLGVAAVGVGAGLMTGAWMLIEIRSNQLEGPALPWALTVWSGAGAAVLAVSGTALLAGAAAGATVALGVLASYSLWRPQVCCAGAVAPAVVLVGGLVAGGWAYAEVTTSSAVLLGVAGPTLGLVRLPSVDASRWNSLFREVGVAAALGAAAVGAGFLPEFESNGSSEAAGDYGGYGGYGESNDDGYDGY